MNVYISYLSIVEGIVYVCYISPGCHTPYNEQSQRVPSSRNLIGKES